MNIMLVDSHDKKIKGGILQFYENGWKDAIDHGDGTFSIQTDKSIINLKMSYEHGIQEKSSISVNGDTVVFKTIPSNVRLLNSQNTPIDEGVIQYYSRGWFPFGITAGGVTQKELLPFNYKFRAASGGVQSEKYQDISTNPIVEFVLQLP
jgi:hypothetical protein